MSIRSIDLQVLIPRSTDASKNLQTSDHQTTLQQQQLADHSQQLAAKQQHQVQHTTKTAGGKVEEREAKNHHSHDPSRNENAPDDQDEAPNETNPAELSPVLGHHIDIKT